MIENVTLLVPTTSLSARIANIVRLYGSVFANIAIGVDDKFDSKPVRPEWLPTSVRLFSFRCPKPGIECAVEEISANCQTDWIFRLDDDELLSSRLVETLMREEGELSRNPSHPISAFAIPRFNCLFQNGKAYFLPGLGRYKLDSQLRFYDRTKVTYVAGLHTPGFLPPENTAFLPPELPMYHLDWICNSYFERLRKLERYESEYQKGFMRSYLTTYCWELNPHILFELQEIEDCVVADSCRFLNAHRATAIWNFQQHEIAQQLQDAFVSGLRLP